MTVRRDSAAQQIRDWLAIGDLPADTTPSAK